MVGPGPGPHAGPMTTTPASSGAPAPSGRRAGATGWPPPAPSSSWPGPPCSWPSGGTRSPLGPSWPPSARDRRVPARGRRRTRRSRPPPTCCSTSARSSCRSTWPRSACGPRSWAPRLLLEGLASRVTFGWAAATEDSVVLRWAAGQPWSCWPAASGPRPPSRRPCCSSPPPSPPRSAGRDALALAWAGTVALAPSVALIERAAVTGSTVTGWLRLAPGHQAPASAAAALGAAVAIAGVARRREQNDLAVVGIVLGAAGAVASWAGTRPPMGHVPVAIAASFLCVETAALVLRDDPFWRVPAAVLAEVGERLAGIGLVLLALWAAVVSGFTRPMPTSPPPPSSPVRDGPSPTAGGARPVCTWRRRPPRCARSPPSSVSPADRSPWASPSRPWPSAPCWSAGPTAPRSLRSPPPPPRWSPPGPRRLRPSWASPEPSSWVRAPCATPAAGPPARSRSGPSRTAPTSSASPPWHRSPSAGGRSCRPPAPRRRCWPPPPSPSPGWPPGLYRGAAIRSQPLGTVVRATSLGLLLWTTGLPRRSPRSWPA